MLIRKNIMIDEDDWKSLELLQDIKKKSDKKISISKITNEAIRIYLNTEKEKNLAFKMQMLATPMDELEEKEILKELSEISKVDFKIKRTIDIK